MATIGECRAERQRRLEQVIADFLEAADSGRDADPTEWLARHPDLRPELAEFFEDQAEFLGLIGAISSGAPTPHIRESAEESPGAAVPYFGDYELGEVLGQGGMGIVFAARQISLNRPVALKMIRAGRLCTDDDRRRFRNEAETVALLDHPNIVPIYEVGEHRKLSFFSMKLVAGGSLNDLVARSRPGAEAGARMTVAIAAAVHHAHQRGILHRDLKPANILIDEQGQPQLTDFGLARPILGETGLTQSGAILGTPAYMAPEQAAGKRVALTVAADVYGIGGVLYFLLCGRPPFRGDTALETLDRVRREPPVPPSKFDRRVPRDLEVICLKCLDKDPNRRYGSARELADDLSRWLDGKPIAARRAGPSRKVLLWCRRNPALAALQLAIVAGAVGTSWNWYRAEQERADAVAASRLANQRLLAEMKARDEARLEAEKTSSVQRFLVRVLLPQAEPGHTPRAHKITVEEALDRGAEQLDAMQSGIPREVELAIRSSIADTFHGLGQYTKSERQWRRALELSPASEGPDGAGTFFVKRRLAEVLVHVGALKEADAMTRDVLEASRRVMGAEHPDTISALILRVEILYKAGAPDQAEPLARESIVASRKTYGPDAIEVLHAEARLAPVLLQQGNAKEAEAIERRCLEAYRRTYGPESPSVLSTMQFLARALLSQGRVAEAEPLLREAIKSSRVVRGDDHDATLGLMRELAEILRGRRALVEAESMAREAWTIGRRARGRDDPETLALADSLAGILADLRRFDEAERLLRETIADARQGPDADRSRLAPLERRLEDVLRSAGRSQDVKR